MNTITFTNSGTFTQTRQTGDVGLNAGEAAIRITGSSAAGLTMSLTNSGTVVNAGLGGNGVNIFGFTGTFDSTSGQPVTPAANATISFTNSGTLKADGGALITQLSVAGQTQSYVAPVFGLAVTATATGNADVTITNAATGVIEAGGALRYGVPSGFNGGGGFPGGIGASPSLPGSPVFRIGPVRDTTAAQAGQAVLDPLSGNPVVSAVAAGLGSVAIGVNAAHVTIINDGTITGGPGGQLPDGVALQSGTIQGTLQVPNPYIAGAIQTFNSTDTLINSKTGVITGSIDLGAGDDRLENYGTINGNVYLRTGNDTVIQGIAATLNGIADGGEGNNRLVIDVTGGGQLTQSLLDHFTNFGSVTVIGRGALSTKGILAVDTVNVGGGTFVIAAGQTLQTTGPTAITGIDGVNNSITNTGTIAGNITLGSGDDHLTNTGLITGSINLGAGNDTLTLQTGNQFGGPVDGGPGINTVVIASTGTETSPEQLQLPTLLDFQQTRLESGTVAYDGTYTTGDFEIAGGRFIGHAGSSIHADTILVDRGATFGSAGTVTANIQVNGTLAPGASPGTMRVVGNVALAATSVSAFEMTPTVTDLLLASGTVTVAPGASLTLSGTRGLAAPLDLIVASGGIAGDFRTINKPATIVGFVAHRGNRIQLFGQFGVAPASGPQVVQTVNAVNAILANGQDSQALDTVLPGLLTAEGTNSQAFALLNPEVYASASQVGTENGLTISTVLRSRSVHGATADTRFFGFAQTLGNFRRLGGNSSLEPSRTSINSYGLLGGIGYGSNTASVAGFAGYLNSNQKINALNAENKGDGVVVGVTGTVLRAGFEVAATLAYDGATANTRRVLPNALQSTSRYGLHSYVADASVGYPVAVGELWAVTPTLGFTHISTKRAAVSEVGGGALALDIRSENHTTDFVDAGVTLTSGKNSRARWQPWLDIGLRYQLSGTDPTATAAFVSTTQTFTVAGVARKTVLARAGTGFSYTISDRASLSAAYRGEYGNNDVGHTINVGIRLGF